MAAERCRHERNSWLIAGGFYEWCYVCGAFRSLQRVPGTTNCMQATSRWQKPSRDKNINPAMQRTKKAADGQ